MPSPSDRALLGYVLDALDPGQTTRLEEEMRADPQQARRMRAIRRRMSKAPQHEERFTAWRLPPPGLSAGPFRAKLMVRASQASEQRLGLHSWTLRLATPEEEEDRLLVVMTLGADGWQVVLPTAPDERVSHRDLLRDSEGNAILALSQAGPEPLRWAVALPPLDWPVDWSLDAEKRWEFLREAVQFWRVPVAVGELIRTDPS